LLAQRIAQSPLFTVDPSYRSEQQVESGLRRAAIRTAIVIPAGYSADLLYLRKPRIRIWLDGPDAATSNFLLAAFDSLALGASIEQVRMRLPAEVLSSGQQPGVTIESHVLSNAGGRTVTFLIPALIAILVQTIMILLMALSIASER